MNKREKVEEQNAKPKLPDGWGASLPHFVPRKKEGEGVVEEPKSLEEAVVSFLNDLADTGETLPPLREIARRLNVQTNGGRRIAGILRNLANEGLIVQWLGTHTFMEDTPRRIFLVLRGVELRTENAPSSSDATDGAMKDPGAEGPSGLTERRGERKC